MRNSKVGKLWFISLIILFYSVNTTVAQEESRLEVSATIIGQNGEPLEGVTIRTASGEVVSTGAGGEFILTDIAPDSMVVIQKEGYAEQIVNVSDLTGPITLQSLPYLATEDDIIDLGIKELTKREITGAVTTINTQDRMVFDNTQFIRDYIGGLIPGVQGSGNIRGLGNALFVIDGVFGRDPNALNMDEVESITVLRDANSVALYGSQARNGVIVINTKRGLVNDKKVTVNFRSGIRRPISYPNYLGAFEYATLFNEARANDGLEPVFTPEAIEAYRTGSNSLEFPDINFYEDPGFLKSFITSTDAVAQFAGGNTNTQYYVNMGWNFDEALVAINPDANKGNTRFNVRANIDFKVNDWIDSSVDVVSVISSDKFANSNLLNFAPNFRPTDYAPLLPLSAITAEPDEELRGILAAANTFDGFLLGTRQEFGGNTPLGQLLAGGRSERLSRTSQFNNSINLDLSMIAEGLSAKTYLSFDFFDVSTEFLSNDFRTYEPTFENGEIVALTPFGNPDFQDITENVRTNDFLSRLGFYGLINYKKSFDEHSFNTTLLGYVNSQQNEGIIQADNSAHAGLQVSYDFKKKLYVDLTGTYANSIRLAEGKRGGFSPTVGLAYIISEENFMQGANFLDYLKIKASGGLLKSDIGINQYFLYDRNFSAGPRFTWNDGNNNSTQRISQGENLNLDFEERIDLNLGLETLLFNKSLWLEFNYFESDYSNQVTRLNQTFPSYYNDFRPYNNFNEDSNQGFEVGMDYTQRLGSDFSVSLGGNLLYQVTTTTKIDQVFEFDYQSRLNRPSDAIFGLVDDGFYSESDFESVDGGARRLNDNLAIPEFGAVQPGDIKYLDLNDDGIINNDDQREIGRFGNPWNYGATFKANYKGITLFVLGTGSFGGQQVRDGDYFWIDGNDTYSEVVLGRWTPETAATATYPRLSSQANDNNFRRSTFWLYENSFFQINRAQLTYSFDEALYSKFGMKNLSINIAGSNLLQIAENKEIRELRVGGNPQFRSFTFGLRTTF
ncbi:MAG: SusC/RagA family TonB-linked outer membrane protein [Leeuwenhoekiella sp.]